MVSDYGTMGKGFIIKSSLLIAVTLETMAWKISNGNKVFFKNAKELRMSTFSRI